MRLSIVLHHLDQVVDHVGVDDLLYWSSFAGCGEVISTCEREVWPTREDFSESDGGKVLLEAIGGLDFGSALGQIAEVDRQFS